MNGDTALAQLLSLALQQRDEAQAIIVQLQAELRDCRAAAVETADEQTSP